jgi:hypothetical protein
MLSGLTLSIQADGRADLGTLVLWVLVHALAAGALIGLAFVLQRWTSCLPLAVGRVIPALILGAGQYLILRTYLPALGAVIWIGVTTLAALFLLAATFIGPLPGMLLWLPVSALLPQGWTRVRAVVERVLMMLGMAGLFGGLLGGTQRVLLQAHLPDAGVWLGAVFLGSFLSLLPLYGRLPYDQEKGERPADTDAANRRFAFSLLTVEAVMLIGAGVATGLVLLQWFG